MIELKGVSKRYGETYAVRELNLNITEGELVVLIGPSGCGKTTTLKMVNRLIEPSGGSIFVDGKNTAQTNPQALRRGIGYVIQSIGLFPHMSVQQNIGVVPELLGWSKARRAERADELLALIGLEPSRYRDAYPSELSGGQQQRVGVARALAVDPPVLLMDEPFGAVDPIARDRLQDEFLRLQAQLKKTIVMVTHDIDEAIKMADRVCVMNAGQIEQYDTPETLLSEPKSKFVREFVGADRALKRLSRVTVQDVMGEVHAIEVSGNINKARSALKTYSVLYVTENGHLRGWLDRKALAGYASIEEAYTRVPLEHATNAQDDARSAVSKMLGEGVLSLPVVSDSGELLGLIELTKLIEFIGEQA